MLLEFRNSTSVLIVKSNQKHELSLEMRSALLSASKSIVIFHPSTLWNRAQCCHGAQKCCQSVAISDGDKRGEQMRFKEIRAAAARGVGDTADLIVFFFVSRLLVHAKFWTLEPRQAGEMTLQRLRSWR